MLQVSRKDISSTEIQKFEDPFLKLPIENYLELVELDPISPQIALINAVNNPKYRFIVAILSRRTGKSTMSNIIGNLVALVPNHHILIMAPNYNLSYISWDLQRSLLKRFNIELEKANAKDRVLELANGSTIRMGSVSQADSSVGRSYDLIIFDECALDDNGENAFNIQLRPTLDKISSKCIFITTPRGKNYVHTFYQRGFNDDFKTWASIRSDYRENPRLTEEDVDDARRSMSIAQFKQEYEADFVSLEGQIYGLSTDCITNNFPVRFEEVIAGLDIGFKDSTAFVVIGVLEGCFYIIDEYVNSGVSTADHAEKMQEMIDEYDIDLIYIDAAAAQTRYDLAAMYEISTINAKKSKLDGIGFISSMIDNKRVFVHPRCVCCIEMFDNYVWDPRASTEKPLHNEHSHPADAIRYAMYTHNMSVLDYGL